MTSGGVVAGVVSTAGWVLARFVPAVFGWWILIGLLLSLGSEVTTTAAHGALADHERRLAATGTMAAGLIGGRTQSESTKRRPTIRGSGDVAHRPTEERNPERRRRGDD